MFMLRPKVQIKRKKVLKFAKSYNLNNNNNYGYSYVEQSPDKYHQQ